MEVFLENMHDSLQVNEQKLSKVAKELLLDEGYLEGELSIVFVDDSYIQQLNEEYLGRDYPTDVLSFPLMDSEGEGFGGGVLGDVYVSLDRAWEQSHEYGVSFEEEVTRLAFHGLLHLLGYDDQSEEDKIIMGEKQESYVQRLLALAD